MRISQLEIKSRKVIGTSSGGPIVGLECIGGLNIVAKDDGGLKILGTGNHMGIARFLAKEADKSIEFTLMEKSEQLDPKFFQDLLPNYRDFTKAMNSAIKK